MTWLKNSWKPRDANYFQWKKDFSWLEVSLDLNSSGISRIDYSGEAYLFFIGLQAIYKYGNANGKLRNFPRDANFGQFKQFSDSQS